MRTRLILRQVMPTIFLQVALNGDSLHPATPRTPAEIAQAARAAADAGAQSVHVHAFDDVGRETLEGAACASVLRAIRARCPATPISLTTSASIVPDPVEPFRSVRMYRARLMGLPQRCVRHRARSVPELTRERRRESPCGASCQRQVPIRRGSRSRGMPIDDHGREKRRRVADLLASRGPRD